MSKFIGKQKEECKVEVVEEKLEEFCPSCIPNPYSPEIDWVVQEEPYFDPRTCEYIAKIVSRKTQDVFINGIEITETVQTGILNETRLTTKKTYSTLRAFVEDFKHEGARHLLQHFGKKINEETLSLGMVPKDGIYVGTNSVINYKIVIKSEQFDSIEELTAQDLEQQNPPENNTTFPDTLTIDDSDFTFFEKLITTKLGILAYEGNYSYFRTIDGGVITYAKEDELIFFKPKDLRDSLSDFKKALDKFLNLNGLSFYSLGGLLGIYDTITNIEIQFDNSDVNKPFKINKVFITSGQCPRKELFKGIEIFKEKAYLPTALNYLINFNKAYGEIIQEEPRDWIEFFEEYTFPPIEIKYGSLDEEEKIQESGLSCALDVDLGKLAGGLMEDFFHSAWDTFSNDFDLLACSDRAIDREPALKQFINPKKQEMAEKLYQEELKRIKKERAAELQELLSSDFRDIPSTEALADEEERIAEEVARIQQEIKEDAASNAEKRLEKVNKEAFKHPFYDHFKNSLKGRLKDDQSILSIFKKVAKEDKPESEKTRSFIASVGLCGISNGFKKALGCLLKQVSLKDLMTAAVRTFFTGFKIQDLSNALRDLMLFLPPEKQIEVQMKVEEELGKITPPWESQDTLNLERKQREKEQQATNREGINPSTTATDGSGAFSAATSSAINKSLTVVLDAYTEAILGTTTTDELIKKYRKEIPAIDLILKSTIEKCPTTPSKDINNKKIKKYKFDVCNPTLPMINFKIPELKFKTNIFASFKNKIKKAIREAILKAISLLVAKMIAILEEKLCKALEVIGKTGLDLLSGKDPDFAQIFKDAFCPNASDEEANDLANSILNKVGAKDTDVQSALDCFSGAIFGSMTQKELLDLITLKDKDEQDLKLFMESIKVGCPRLYDLVNTLNKAENFFNNIGNLIPEDIRATLQAALPFEEGVPFYNSICLTSEELRMWDQIRRNGLLASGLSPEDAAAQVDLYNQRAKDALAAALDALNNGPEKELNDLIRDLFNPPDQKPDGCELPEGESNYGNKVLKEPKELVNIQDDISNIIFDNILEDASRELSKTFNPFGKASIMEKILSDTEGNHYGLHRLYESWLFTRNTYHDSEPAGALKDERFVFGLDFIGEPRGFFPDSVGQHMKDQLTSEESPFLSVVEIEPEDTLMFYDPNSDLEYTVVKSFEKEQTNYSKFFTREVQTSPVTKYDLNGSVGFISDNLINPAQTLDYKINLSFPFKGLDLLLLERVSSTQLDELDVQVNPDLSFRNNVFNSFLLNKISSLTSKINLSQKENFEKTMTEVFNSTNLLLLENTNGFSFGFEEEDLEADDLRYVDPAPESEAYTHEESEKVLGKSYTDNSRVTFLNPEEYGGSFTVPPVYIRPKEQRGWLKYSKVLFPDEEECDPKSQDLINHAAVKRFVNNRRNSIVMDNQKLSKISEDCYFDRPFDKILTKNATSSIDGIMKVQIRAAIAKELIKGLPISSCLKMNKDNYDSSNLKYIIDQLIQDLKSINPFGPYKIEKENYYLLFLEQCTQFYRDTVIEKLPKLTNKETGEELGEKDYSSLPPEIKQSYKKIKSFTDTFSYENTMVPQKSEIALLGSTEVDSSVLLRSDFNALAGAFQEIGQKMFTSKTEFYDYKPEFLQSIQTTNLYSVLFSIKLCEKEALDILKEIVFKEYEEMVEFFYTKEPPVIDSIHKSILTSGLLFSDNNLQNFGFSEYESKISIGSFESMGTPNDVVDTFTQRNFNPELDPMFKIERFVRIKEKDELNLPEDVLDILNSRTHELRGVVSIENLQAFIDENIETLGEYYISDLFGDASLQDEVFSGNIGMSSGMRILINLPLVSIEEGFTPEDIETSKMEKCYFNDISNMNSENFAFSIPIVSVEIDLKEAKLKELNLVADYDVDCLARKLVSNESYLFFFKEIIPIQAASSILLNYSNLFFLNSIGNNDGWNVKNPAVLTDSNSFEKTNLKCRKYFASFYTSNKLTNSENIRLPKIEFPDLWKILFGGFSFPEINLNLIIPIEFRFDHKVVKTNPFDSENNKCNE
tara:strand:- start:1772 stop:7894 length:6123 start_codon:yes stop_codon:yes gene_type:complete